MFFLLFYRTCFLNEAKDVLVAVPDFYVVFDLAMFCGF